MKTSISNLKACDKHEKTYALYCLWISTAINHYVLKYENDKETWHSTINYERQSMHESLGGCNMVQTLWAETLS